MERETPNTMETNTPMKRCTHCGAEKPKSEFYGRSSSQDGLQSWCKACLKAYTTDYYRRIRIDALQRGGAPPFEGNPAYGSLARVMPARHPDAPPLNADLTRFTARQLMRELYARGYEGELRITQRVNIATCKR